jgi:hypothetical protein
MTHNKQHRYKELPPNTPIQVDLKNATQKFCPCGCPHFMQVSNVYIVSALVSPTGQELMANSPVLICVECHTPYGQAKAGAA